MKTIVCIIMFILPYSLVLSQSTFEFLYSSPLNEISRSMIEDADGNVYFSVENHQYGLIIKLDQEGMFVDSVRVENTTGTCNLAELVTLGNNHFVAMGVWTNDSISEMWFVLFNSDLKVINDIKLNTNNFYIFEFHHIINAIGNIIIIAHYRKPPDFKPDICMYEVAKDGSLIRYAFFNTSSSYNHGYSLIEDPSDHTYKIFAKSELESKLPCLVNIVDTNFNFLYSHFIPMSKIDTPVSAKWLNDSVYVLSGRSLIWSTEEWDIGILRLNRNDSVLSSNYFGREGIVEWAGLYKSLDFVTPDNIYLAGSSNTYFYPYQNDYSWIMLNILDADLNLKSQHYYGGDAFYLVNAIMVTQDSGCVLSCSRYDYLTQNQEFDIYILKVNKDGLLVSTPEYPQMIGSLTGSVYPNPGKDAINIQSPDEQCIIQFFNLIGKLEFKTQLKKGLNTLSVPDLPAGMYLYRLSDQNQKFIQSGKWIKLNN